MNRKIIPFMSVVIALILVLGLSACGGSNNQSQQGQPSQQGSSSTSSSGTQSSPSQPSAPAASDEGPEYGGMFRIGTGADTAMPLGFPWEHQVFPSQFILSPYIEPLLAAKNDGTFTPWLAESYIVDVEHDELYFKLRKDVRFTDGSVFNAEVAAWNMQMQVDAKQMNPTVLGAEVRGEYEYAVILANYLNVIVPTFANRPFSMISKENYDKNGADYAMMNPVGTGPFVLNDWVPGSKVSFVKNNDYWQEGKPYLDSVEFIAMSDVMTQNAALMSTGSDGIDQLSTGNGEQISMLMASAPIYVKEQQGGFNALIPSSMNADSPLAKLEVRQAVSYAIDRESIVEARGFGILRPSTQLLAEGFIGHLADDSLNVRYDPGKAKELLSNAGYPNGFTTTIYGMGGSDRDTLVAIQGMLGEIGITASIEFPEAGAAAELRTGYWEGFLYTGVGNFINSGTTFRFMLDPGYDNFPTMWRPDIKDLYDAVRAAPTLVLEEQYASELNRLGLENMLMIPIIDTKSCFILRNNVHDTGFGDYTAQTVWLPSETWKSSK